MVMRDDEGVRALSLSARAAQRGGGKRSSQMASAQSCSARAHTHTHTHTHTASLRTSIELIAAKSELDELRHATHCVWDCSNEFVVLQVEVFEHFQHANGLW